MTTPPPADPPRDYVGAMRRLIEAETAGSYIPGVAATRIVRRLRENDPDLLQGWLDHQAAQFVRQAISERDRSKRTAARYHTPRSVFAADAAAAEKGEVQRLNRWMDIKFAVSDGFHVPLRAMTKPDLEFVATTYEVRAKGQAMMAAFLQAIANRVGNDTVEEHYSDEELTRMWESLTH